MGPFQQPPQMYVIQLLLATATKFSGCDVFGGLKLSLRRRIRRKNNQPVHWPGVDSLFHLHICRPGVAGFGRLQTLVMSATLWNQTKGLSDQY